MTAVEPGATLNSLCQVPGTGLLLLGADAPRIECYYVPALGAAPRWCAFLDALCEELEEATASGGERPAWAAKAFDDYKFLSREQLERLGLSHLIGALASAFQSFAMFPYGWRQSEIQLFNHFWKIDSSFGINNFVIN